MDENNCGREVNPLKKEEKNSVKFRIIMALLSFLFLVFVFMAILKAIQSCEPVDYIKPPPVPHFELNSKKYWESPYYGQAILHKLPANYQLVDTVSESADYVDKGDQIYIDQSNPDAAYLWPKALIDHGEKKYFLFVTQKLRDVLFFYKGSLFKQQDEIVADLSNLPWDTKAGFKCVGKVKSAEYIKIPSHELEANFAYSVGSDVYASKAEKDTIYIDQFSIGGEFYLKFKKQ